MSNQFLGDFGDSLISFLQFALSGDWRSRSPLIQMWVLRRRNLTNKRFWENNLYVSYVKPNDQNISF